MEPGESDVTDRFVQERPGIRHSMHTAYLSLGSNLGDRRANLEAAMARLLSGSVRIAGVSSVYETDPIGETETPVPDYLNIVVKVETDLPPQELLRHLQNVERSGGRVRSVRWGSRTIDIDLLLYDDLVMDSEELTVPHPRMFERAFVLAPLSEIEQDLVLPDGSLLASRLNDPVVGSQKIRKCHSTDTKH